LDPRYAAPVLIGGVILAGVATLLGCLLCAVPPSPFPPIATKATLEEAI
jgi:hypothetical protein